jgi:hypothetical protein
MRDSKRVEGDTPVELKTQSRKAGIAAGGTCLKLSDNEVITDEPISIEASNFKKIGCKQPE